MTTQDELTQGPPFHIPDVFTDPQQISARPSKANICALLNIDTAYPKQQMDLFLAGMSETDTYYDVLVHVIADELFVKPKIQPGYHKSGQHDPAFIRNNEDGYVSPVRRASDQKPMNKTLKDIFDGKLWGDDLTMPKQWKGWIDRSLPVLVADAKKVQRKRDDAKKNPRARQNAQANVPQSTSRPQQVVGPIGPLLTARQEKYREAVMSGRTKISVELYENEVKSKMDWGSEAEEDVGPE